MFMHNFFLLYKDKSNFVYVLVHRNILMYIYLHTIYLCRYAYKTILAVCLVFSILRSAHPPPLHMRKILLVLNEHHLNCYVQVLIFV